MHNAKWIIRKAQAVKRNTQCVTDDSWCVPGLCVPPSPCLRVLFEPQARLLVCLDPLA